MKQRNNFIVEFEKNYPKCMIENRVGDNSNTRFYTVQETKDKFVFELCTVFTEEELKSWLYKSKYFKNAIVKRG